MAVQNVGGKEKKEDSVDLKKKYNTKSIKECKVLIITRMTV